MPCRGVPPPAPAVLCQPVADSARRPAPPPPAHALFFILRLWSQVASFKNLKLLDLSNNSIVALDPEILSLAMLENFNLSGNKLKELPKVRSYRS